MRRDANQAGSLRSVSSLDALVLGCQVRAGCTPKFKDVDVLCEMLVYSPAPREKQVGQSPLPPLPLPPLSSPLRELLHHSSYLLWAVLTILISK